MRNAAIADNGPDRNNPAPTTSGLDLAEAARAMARLEGEISKDVDEYNKRPRKKFIGARTEEYHFAPVSRCLAREGPADRHLQFPEAARGKIYGSLILTVAINADGSVGRIDINRLGPLGSRRRGPPHRPDGLPYAAFPPEIRKDTDILEITRTWYFTQGNNLETKAR